jgi:hypothetical protein
METQRNGTTLVARALSWLGLPPPEAPAPMTYEQARAAYVSACARGDQAAAREALQAMVDAQSVTAGVACVSQPQ